MKLHLLDTSGLSWLVEPDHALVRHRLLDEVAAERIVVLATDPLTWEFPATRAKNDAKYRAMAELLFRVTLGRALVDPNRRRRREVRLGRGLTLAELVDDERKFRPVYDAETVDRGSAHDLGVALGLRFHEAERAEDAVRGLNEADPTGWSATLEEESRKESWLLGLAEDFARDAVDDYGAQVGLEVAHLNPRELPTFWMSALIHVARIRAVIVHGTSPTGNKSTNQLDLLHLEEAASYADVFVCRDRRLRVFSNAVPQMKCAVLTFEEWADQLVR